MRDTARRAASVLEQLKELRVEQHDIRAALQVVAPFLPSHTSHDLHYLQAVKLSSTAVAATAAWTRVPWTAPFVGATNGITWNTTNNEATIQREAWYLVQAHITAGVVANGHQLRVSRLRGVVTEYQLGDEVREAFGTNWTWMGGIRMEYWEVGDIMGVDTKSAAAGQAFTLEADRKVQFFICQVPV